MNIINCILRDHNPFGSNRFGDKIIAFQNIELFDNFPVIDQERCAGCSLCYQVCPEKATTIIEIN
ncbi:4Fe-4S binding protein [bacterium]|nr:4Fe-4S binding protein [bacterium]